MLCFLLPISNSNGSSVNQSIKIQMSSSIPSCKCRLIKSVIVYLMVSCYMDNCGKHMTVVILEPIYAEKLQCLEGLYWLDRKPMGASPSWWFIITYWITWPYESIWFSHAQKPDTLALGIATRADIQSDRYGVEFFSIVQGFWETTQYLKQSVWWYT
jgi:hypothetical protein